MTPAGINRLKSDEGYREAAYIIDGVLHIGYGFNLERPDAVDLLRKVGVKPQEIPLVMKKGGQKLSRSQVDALFEITLIEAQDNARKVVKNYDSLPAPVRDVMINMSFQLGREGLSKFKETLSAVEQEDWDTVEKRLKSAKIYKQTPQRIDRHIKSIREVAKNKTSSENKREEQQKLEEKAAPKSKKQELTPLEASIVSELEKAMSERGILDELTNFFKNQKVEEETKPTEETKEAPKQKLQKLQQGLYQNDNGESYFVDDKNRVFSIGEDGTPTAKIDPSNFDLSAFEDTEDAGA